MPNNLDAITPEFMSLNTQLTRDKSGVFSQLVNKAFETERTYGDTVLVPVHSDFTIGDANDDGTDNSVEDRTPTVETLLIDKHKYALAHYGDAELQLLKSSASFMEAESRKMGEGLAEELDRTLLAQIKADANGTLGAFGGGVTDALLQDIAEAFDDAEVPEEERFAVFPTAGKKQILAIDKFTTPASRSQQQIELLENGMARSTVKNYLGEFYGTKVFRSGLFTAEAGSPTAYQAVAFSRSSLALVVVQDVQFEMDRRLRAIGTDALAHTHYGHKVVRPDEAWKVNI